MAYSNTFIAVFFWMGSASLGYAADPCQQTRCLLDIGSSAIKAKVAKVDSCQQRVLQVLSSSADSRRDVPFGDSLNRIAQEPVAAAKRAATLALQKRGVAALVFFQQRARALGAKGCRAVATATFRNSALGQVLAAKLSQQSGVPIDVISQSREGQLEVFGALARASLSSVEAKHAVVWGVGSTSMQLTPTDDFQGFDGELASLGFRDRVLEEVKKQKTGSPNPLSVQQVEQARELAERLAEQSAIPDGLKKKIRASDAIILGVGGTLNLSVKMQLGSDERVTAAGLRRAIEARTGKDDDDPLFGGREHAATQLTNLILVEAFLGKLGMREVRYVDSDLTDGALVHPDFWK